MTSHSDITKRYPQPMQIWSRTHVLATEVALINGLDMIADEVVVKYTKLSGLHAGKTYITCVVSFLKLYTPSH